MLPLRAFIERSFGNFLQTEVQQQRIVEADKLEAKARELLKEVKKSASTDVKKLSVGRMCGMVWERSQSPPGRL